MSPSNSEGTCKRGDDTATTLTTALKLLTPAHPPIETARKIKQTKGGDEEKRGATMPVTLTVLGKGIQWRDPMRSRCLT